VELIKEMREGKETALARLISLVERNDPQAPDIMRAIQPLLGNAYTIGITGPPGAGKSSLTNKLTQQLREQGFTVGIIAIDPSSPFTGGAVLGDRVRMEDHYLDPGVFIRSLASRGSHGGLAEATKDAIKILDASGKDFIIVETVGVGQTELDVIQAVDTVAVVLVPEGGDAIQMLKAGLMEIADTFVVNKADRDGAPQIVTSLKSILHLKYCDFITRTGELDRRRRERRREDLMSKLQFLMRDTLQTACADSGDIGEIVERVVTGVDASHSVIKELLPLTLDYMRNQSKNISTGVTS